MNETRESGAEQKSPLLDRFLGDLLPEIKLALGALIDRENQRRVPDRYARNLPDTLLAVTLRPDLAEAVEPVAEEVERDLTDSCSRHGSLYDRSYRVELRRAEPETGPLYRVSAHAGHPPPAAPAPPAEPSDPAEAPEPAKREIPVSDPDETRMEGAGGGGWEPGRFLLVVEDDGTDEAREVFRLTEPLTTVGRQSDDPALHTIVSLSGVPHVSRRQLALVWDIRNGSPGFWLFNIGLNPVRVDDKEVAGHRVEPGALHLERVPDASSAWITAGARIRLGSEGPTLRIEEVGDEPALDGEDAMDPDATRVG